MKKKVKWLLLGFGGLFGVTLLTVFIRFLGDEVVYQREVELAEKAGLGTDLSFFDSEYGTRLSSEDLESSPFTLPKFGQSYAQYQGGKASADFFLKDSESALGDLIPERLKSEPSRLELTSDEWSYLGGAGIVELQEIALYYIYRAHAHWTLGDIEDVRQSLDMALLSLNWLRHQQYFNSLSVWNRCVFHLRLALLDQVFYGRDSQLTVDYVQNVFDQLDKPSFPEMMKGQSALRTHHLRNYSEYLNLATVMWDYEPSRREEFDLRLLSEKRMAAKFLARFRQMHEVALDSTLSHGERIKQFKDLEQVSSWNKTEARELTKALAVSEAYDEILYWETWEQLSFIGLALREFFLVHGRYPDHLEELEGDLSLIDPFSGKPLGYRSNGDSFVAYSVGFDRADQGGQITDVDDLILQTIDREEPLFCGMPVIFRPIR